MDDTYFKILSDFLDSEPRVEGRGQATVDDELLEEINSFVKGELPNDKRPDFCRRILLNPRAIELLAEKLKNPSKD